MRTMSLMENLLAIEAETKFLLAAGDRSYEQTFDAGIVEDIQRG